MSIALRLLGKCRLYLASTYFPLCRECRTLTLWMWNRASISNSRGRSPGNQHGHWSICFNIFLAFGDKNPSPYINESSWKMNTHRTKASKGSPFLKCVVTIWSLSVRDGCGYSKWKFKMVFAMKGGGLECHIPILKNDFFENHLESFPDC